jgi:hypothetical protein
MQFFLTHILAAWLAPLLFLWFGGLVYAFETVPGKRWPWSKAVKASSFTMLPLTWAMATLGDQRPSEGYLWWGLLTIVFSAVSWSACSYFEAREGKLRRGYFFIFLAVLTSSGFLFRSLTAWSKTGRETFFSMERWQFVILNVVTVLSILIFGALAWWLSTIDSPSEEATTLMASQPALDTTAYRKADGDDH